MAKKKFFEKNFFFEKKSFFGQKSTFLGGIGGADGGGGGVTMVRQLQGMAILRIRSIILFLRQIPDISAFCQTRGNR